MSDRVDPSPAFRALQAALWRRRLSAVEAQLRLELAAIVVLAAGFLFWQFRLPLAALAHRAGAAAVARWLALALAGLALGGAAAAGTRHAARLRRGPPGPAWLALPLEPRALARHLAWEAQGPAWLVVPPAAALLAAAWHLVPTAWLAGLAAAFGLALAATGRLAAGIAFRLVAARATPPRALDPLVRVLVYAGRDAAPRHRPAPHWRGGPAWLALWRKDLAVTRAPSPARARALVPLAFAAASVATWRAPLASAPLVHALAFALALIAAGALAEWLVALAGSDPFSALRVLPLGARAMWTARAASAFTFVAALLAAHALGARGLSPLALRLFLVWTGAAAVAIAVLGVNYGVTLFPRADVASRLLALSLGLAIAASLMIPLAGWVLLLAAVLHSARRLPRWSRLEEVV